MGCSELRTKKEPTEATKNDRTETKKSNAIWKIVKKMLKYAVLEGIESEPAAEDSEIEMDDLKKEVDQISRKFPDIRKTAGEGFESFCTTAVENAKKLNLFD